MSRESRNQNQPTRDHRANSPRPLAAPPEDQGLAAGDIEGVKAKTREEYKENPQAARAEYIFLPPDIRTEYIFLPPATVPPPAQTTRPGASQEHENPKAVRTEYNWTVGPLPPTGVAPSAQSTWPVRSLPVAEYNCPVRSLPPQTVAPPAQSTWPGASHSGGYTTENRVKRKRPVENEAASAKPYRCRFCTEIFSSKQALGGHMSFHGQEKQNELAERQDEVGGHMSVDCLVPSFQCSFCPKSFSSRRGLGGHVKCHSQEIKEKLDTARNRPESKVQLSLSMFHNNCSPSQIQSQFAGTPTLPPSSLESQHKAPQAQEGQYHHTPNMRVVDLNVDLWQVEDFGKPEDLAIRPQCNTFDLNADLWRSLDSGKAEGLEAINIQNRPLGAKNTWCNRADMVPTTSTTTTQDPQPHHDQPQLMHSDPKSGVGASMQRSYPYHQLSLLHKRDSLGQGIASSSSSTVAVTQEGFNPRFQRHQYPKSGVGASMQRNYPYSLGPSSSSPVAVTQWGFNPSIQRQNPASPTRNSRVNEESRMANVSGSFRGNIALPTQFPLSLGWNSQKDINAIAREVINVSSSFSNSDIDTNSSSSD